MAAGFHSPLPILGLGAEGAPVTGPGFRSPLFILGLVAVGSVVPPVPVPPAPVPGEGAEWPFIGDQLGRRPQRTGRPRLDRPKLVLPAYNEQEEIDLLLTIAAAMMADESCHSPN